MYNKYSNKLYQVWGKHPKDQKVNTVIFLSISLSLFSLITIFNSKLSQKSYRFPIWWNWASWLGNTLFRSLSCRDYHCSSFLLSSGSVPFGILLFPLLTGCLMWQMWWGLELRFTCFPLHLAFFGPVLTWKLLQKIWSNVTCIFLFGLLFLWLWKGRFWNSYLLRNFWVFPFQTIFCVFIRSRLREQFYRPNFLSFRSCRHSLVIILNFSWTVLFRGVTYHFWSFPFNRVFLCHTLDQGTFRCDLFYFFFSYVSEVSCHKSIGLVQDHIFRDTCFWR